MRRRWRRSYAATTSQEPGAVDKGEQQSVGRQPLLPRETAAALTGWVGEVGTIVNALAAPSGWRPAENSDSKPNRRISGCNGPSA